MPACCSWRELMKRMLCASAGYVKAGFGDRYTHKAVHRVDAYHAQRAHQNIHVPVTCAGRTVHEAWLLRVFVLSFFRCLMVISPGLRASLPRRWFRWLELCLLFGRVAESREYFLGIAAEGGALVVRRLVVRQGEGHSDSHELAIVPPWSIFTRVLPS